MTETECEFYPDLDNHKYGRPEGFENEERDCTVRALSLAGNIQYENVHKAFEINGRKDRHCVMIEPILHKVCKLLNLKAKQVKRSGTLKKFINQFPKGNYFCIKRGHAFAVIDGVSHDEDLMNSHIQGAWLITKII